MGLLMTCRENNLISWNVSNFPNFWTPAPISFSILPQPNILVIFMECLWLAEGEDLISWSFQMRRMLWYFFDLLNTCLNPTHICNPNSEWYLWIACGLQRDRERGLRMPHMLSGLLLHLRACCQVYSIWKASLLVWRAKILTLDSVGLCPAVGWARGE